MSSIPSDETLLSTSSSYCAVAIVGMAGRFPGARNIDEFWKNLRNGVDSISHFSELELEDAFPDEVRHGDEFVRAKPVIDDVEMFDANFFGMHAREAALTDPQHRILLECAWEALEDAGHDPAKYTGSIGVFAGCSMNTYFINNVCGDRETVERFTSNFQVGEYQMLLGALQDFVATRVAYKLDLRGPSFTLGSGCSTSLLAVTQACQNLLTYQCDMALAGGVSITFPQKRGYIYQQGGMVSPDGVCRPFDKDAAGTVFGSGAGCVLLKRLEDAIAERNHIYAVIRGFGVNNDGAGKVGFTAPSVDGQAQAIIAAHSMAAFDARTIGYVECHGTATPLGDPIEFAGLEKAFRTSTQASEFCALGSAKANVGHLDAAAGVTGLIKAALSLKYKELPPLAHFSSPNPQIKATQSPFYFNSELSSWPSGNIPRRAGVSSFGVGGTNVHVVLEESTASFAPTIADIIKLGGTSGPLLLPVSAASESSLANAKLRLANHLTKNSGANLHAVAFTLQAGRRNCKFRTAIVCNDVQDAIGKLRASPESQGSLDRNAPRIVFMFPGQGAQYLGMSRSLYHQTRIVREVVDECAEILEPVLDCDLRKILFESTADEDAPNPIRSTVLAQPALFVVEYAIARLLMSCGVSPDAMIGHSVGEFVAACIAKVFSLTDALHLIAERGRLMQGVEAGAMLAVRLPEIELRPLLGKSLEIAAINTKSLCVASGPFDAIESLEAELERRGASSRRLHTSHAFHSAMMEPAVDGLFDAVSRVRLQPPSIPYISCVTGKWITSNEAISAEYWARHCRSTVRFFDGLKSAAEARDTLFIEIGPGRTLTTFASQTLTNGGTRAIINTLPEFADREDESAVFLNALGRLWTNGIDLDWQKLNGDIAFRVPLPTYAFDRQRHWIDAPQPMRGKPGSPSPVSKDDGSKDDGATISEPAPVSAATLTNQIIADANEVAMPSRTNTLANQIVNILEDLSGEQLQSAAPTTTFLELGFDSLFLGQLAQRIQKQFGVKVTFRQLMKEFSSPFELAAFLDGAIPPDIPEPAQTVPSLKQPPPQVQVAQVAPIASTAEPLGLGTQNIIPASDQQMVPGRTAAAGAPFDVQGIIQAQLTAMQRLMSEQLGIVQSIGASFAHSPRIEISAVASSPPKITDEHLAPPAIAKPQAQSDHPASETPSRFSVYRGATGAGNDVTSASQQQFIDTLIAKYNAKTPGSKAYTQTYRRVLADPRAANGFRAEWKELVYPIVCAKAKGSKIWDVDGNAYVDLVNGYGQTVFGHSPDFVIEALTQQMAEGFPIGPQSPLAGEVASLFSELTGNERVTFCNTGSEAVMAAMRVARTVTGRSKVVVFGGAYHGQFDEVLIKGARAGAPPKALPVAPGIPIESVSNMVVLPYATPESLAWIRENANDLAAVVAETVQSRHPAMQPREFLKELRDITSTSGTALVFDEVVTGFRVHPGGMQALFEIEADLATYGKVVGGGMPIGILAGKRKFMDALDGGFWSYGDTSSPEVAPTFFAGTFVRHPLALAAARAVLKYLKNQGSNLQAALAEKTAQLVKTINDNLERRGIQSRAEAFSSWFYINLANEDRLSSLLYPTMRLHGVHIHEGFPCFLTTAHSDEDIAAIAKAFSDSLDALQAAGILTAKEQTSSAVDRSNTISSKSGLPDEVRLTEPQTEIWLAAQNSGEASCAFNESVSLRLDGNLNPSALSSALNDVVARHEALRATFARTGNTMRVAAQAAVMLPIVDLRKSGEQQSELAQLIDDDACTPFDLVEGPVFRAKLIQLSNTSNVLLFTAHHIVCDGWSMNVIMQELSSCYAAKLQGVPADLPAPMPFRRYAIEQAAQAQDAGKEAAFWLSQFKDLPLPVEVPLDRSRPARKSFHGACHVDHIEADLTRAVKKSGARHGCTLFATLYSAMQVLIGRLADHNDVVLAVPTAGQSLIDEGVLVGHCVNFLPLRAPFEPEQTFGAHLANVNQRLGQAFDHPNYTFGTLVRKLAIKRDVNRLPLTDIQFNLEKLGTGVDFPGLAATLSPNPKAFTNFDLFFNFAESEAGLRIDVDYSTDLFDDATIARWIGHLKTLLSAFAAGADLPIAAMPLLSDVEKRDLLQNWNETQRDCVSHQTMHELFSAQAARTPDAIAVSNSEGKLTYRELDERSNQAARFIQAALPERGRVAVAVDRGLDLVTILLAVMKAGHAYVPLDPQHPAQRLTETVLAAEVGLVITSAGAVIATPSSIARIELKSCREAIAREATTALPPAESASGHRDRSAYVIFTSGSTGVPKGVEVSHRALANLLLSMAERPGFTPSDVMLAITTVSFDIAALELFLPLICGGRVEIAPREAVKDGFALVRLIDSSGATALQATPSLWRMLLEAGLTHRRPLKILCGGEALQRELANQLLKISDEVWNLYGPTETTIWSAIEKLGSDDDRITIGFPIANTELHVLDQTGTVVPIGVVGELNIGGAGLANGYLGHPDLTNASFRNVKLGENATHRLYRTGDLARRLKDGRIEVLGRRDQQIKLRGFRIEIGDIETALRAAPGVAECAVALRNDERGDARLAAYIVGAEGEEFDPQKLAAHLGTLLPDYMVPTLWKLLDALPRTENGKLDRRSLVAIDARVVDKRNITAPRTDLERSIAAVWQDVLGQTEISVDDNIFALGADSIHIFRIAARLIEGGIPIEARNILKTPTIAELAAQAAQPKAEKAPNGGIPSLQDFRRGSRRMSDGARSR